MRSRGIQRGFKNCYLGAAIIYLTGLLWPSQISYKNYCLRATKKASIETFFVMQSKLLIYVVPVEAFCCVPA
ncbi:hypothetical protein PSBY109024_16865 [Pseudoalteromonas byunsanensis]